MAEENELKESVKESVKNVVKETVSEIVRRLTKASTKKAIVELKKKLKEKAIHRLEGRLEGVTEQRLERQLNKSIKQVERGIVKDSPNRADFIEGIERGFGKSFEKYLSSLKGLAPLNLIATICGCLLVVGGGVSAGALILPNSVTISIENCGCDTIEVAGALDFLPGVDFPGEIPRGETGTVRVPKAFAGGFEAHTGEVVIEAFGGTFHVPINNLDLQRSTWDGTTLAELEGEQVSIGEGNIHSLVIFCR